MMRHQGAGRVRARIWCAATVLLTLGTASATVAQSPLGTSGAAAHPELVGQTLVVSDWASYLPADLPALFEAEYGVPVRMAIQTSDQEVADAIDSGDAGIDVAFLSGPVAQSLGARGMLASIDHARVPNLSNLYPEASQLAYDVGNVFSVPFAWGTTGLCYRADLTGYDPDSWYDLLTPRVNVSGRTTALATQRWLMLPAQKALGFSANTTDASEMAQVRELLLAAQPTLLAYDDTSFPERLVDGEVSLAEAWDGWCDEAIGDPDQGPNVRWVVPREGSDLWVDTMTVPESSRDREAAHAFIDFVLRPEVQAWVVENIHYKVPNAAAMALVDPDTLDAFPDLSMTPAELLEGDTLTDLGPTGRDLYQGISDEVMGLG